MKQVRRVIALLMLGLGSSLTSTAQEPRAFEAPKQLVPPPIGQETLPELITQFSADLQTIKRRFRFPTDPLLDGFYINLLQSWRERIDAIEFSKLDRDSQLDWLMFSGEIEHLKFLHTKNRSRDNESLHLIPYANLICRFCSSKEHGIHLSAEAAAELLDKVAKLADEDRKRILANPRSATENSNQAAKAVVEIRAAELIEQFIPLVRETHNFYDGYDPQYMWWAGKPYNTAVEAIKSHGKAIRERLAGLAEEDPDKIVGIPIGGEALIKSLSHAWIPYSVEELIKIGERELEWCEAEFRKAADELGCDGDAKKALNLVKARYVDPGEQPEMIRDLAWEAINFLEANDLLSIPNLVKYGWRLEMMSPEAQRVNPYFLGGDNIIVSFPTNTMTHDEKLMSLRSNNIHFCRATVHHELVPGHHMQYYCLARFRPYRALFESPFWMEGWALYWEMVLWDKHFAQSAEDRIGMLFWRRHRAARIIFSLNYQAGKWTAEECVRYLIDRVGHEPSAAAAEVRRSVTGNYGPLYQAAYMLGGLQLRSLEKELVKSGKMTYREFHDAILRENYMPFELLRAKLLNLPLSKNQQSTWRF